MNFRADRAREMTTALTDGVVHRICPAHAQTCSLRLPVALWRACAHLATAFRNDPIVNGLGEVLAANHLKQLRIAGRKNTPVTYFFSGGREQAYPVKIACWCRRQRSKPTT